MSMSQLPKIIQVITLHDDGSVEYESWDLSPLSDFEPRLRSELGSPFDHFKLSEDQVRLSNALFAPEEMGK